MIKIKKITTWIPVTDIPSVTCEKKLWRKMI